MSHNSGTDRRARILDAAENAFAECGFQGASLRRIVLEARVNLATVYYYFGSKAGLAGAVLKRRFEPLRQEHLECLRRFSLETRGRSLSVEKILEAMLLPSLRLAETDSAQREAVTRLFGRIATEPNVQIQEILRQQRKDVRAAFLKALQSSLPNIPVTDLRWRMEFVWGALGFILCNPRRIEEETNGACDPKDARRVLTEMVRFFAPGFRAVGGEIRNPKSDPPLPSFGAARIRKKPEVRSPKRQGAAGARYLRTSAG